MSHGASINRSMVARVAPKRIGPRPCPARIANSGPVGTGNRSVCATGGSFDATAVMDAELGAPSAVDERWQLGIAASTPSASVQDPEANFEATMAGDYSLCAVRGGGGTQTH